MSSPAGTTNIDKDHGSEDQTGSSWALEKESNNSISSFGDASSLGPTDMDNGRLDREESIGEFSSNPSEPRSSLGLGASYGTSLNDEIDEVATISSHASGSSIPEQEPSTPLRGNNKPSTQSNRQVSFGVATAMPLNPNSGRMHSLTGHLSESEFTENDDTEGADSYYSKDTSQGEESDYNDLMSPRQGLEEYGMGSSGKVLVHNNKRLSLSVDLETGIEGGTRSQQAWIRPEPTVQQSMARRRRQGMKSMLYNNGSDALSFIVRKPRERVEDQNSDRSGHDDDDMRTSTHGRLAVRETKVVIDEDDEALVRKPSRTQVQYNLQTIQERGQLKGQLSMAFGLSPSNPGAEGELAVSSQKGLSLKFDFLVIKYFHWAFRSSFSAVFCSGALAFFSLTLLFAVLIYLSGINKPSCIHVNGVDFGTTGANFMDAYALSWTTFSTVGYGLVFPATSATNPNIRWCTGITVLTTMESFVGILFASICGAILFAKVTRIASFAQVTFSDPIVIRYGSGVMTQDGDDDEEGKSSDGEGEFEDLGSPSGIKLSNMPCPILEFRVINRLHSVVGGEIIDATMNIVACIDEKQALPSVGKTLGTRRRGKKGKKRGPRRGGSQHVDSGSGSFSSSRSEHASRRLNRARESVRELFRQQSIPSENLRRKSRIVEPRVYAKLEIESPEHPFFKRVWLARHTLDHNSPLLLPPARDLVKRNGGHWPEDLNSASAVRKVVKFDQILVSLSGTSNVDANSVYAQKAYDHVDICIGYRFCNLLFRATDGSLGVDTSLLNDVAEQSGGGGEPLDNRGNDPDLRHSIVG